MLSVSYASALAMASSTRLRESCSSSRDWSRIWSALSPRALSYGSKNCSATSRPGTRSIGVTAPAALATIAPSALRPSRLECPCRRYDTQGLALIRSGFQAFASTRSTPGTDSHTSRPCLVPSTADAGTTALLLSMQGGSAVTPWALAWRRLWAIPLRALARPSAGDHTGRAERPARAVTPRSDRKMRRRQGLAVDDAAEGGPRCLRDSCLCLSGDACPPLARTR